ncbi:MAG: helix-turn-helix domain-containing protein [Candidatus Eisenbacteria bacterium]|nr:helix-turn-helix domain-containing protein [Candidatus Eisenbacteria bacterium]
MTTSQRIARGRLTLLELGEQLKNVSEACRMMGVSRLHFYEIKKVYGEGGLEALKAKSRRVPNPKNRVAPLPPCGPGLLQSPGSSTLGQPRLHRSRARRPSLRSRGWSTRGRPLRFAARAPCGEHPATTRRPAHARPATTHARPTPTPRPPRARPTPHPRPTRDKPSVRQKHCSENSIACPWPCFYHSNAELSGAGRRVPSSAIPNRR